MLKTRLDVALSTLLQLPLPEQKGWTRPSPAVPSHLSSQRCCDRGAEWLVKAARSTFSRREKTKQSKTKKQNPKREGFYTVEGSRYGPIKTNSPIK